MKRKRETVAIVFDQFAPYHMDRVEAVGRILMDSYQVIGVELADRSTTYDWEPTGASAYFKKITLFPGSKWEDILSIKRFWGLIKSLVSCRAKYIFLVNYERLDIFLTASVARLLGSRPFFMMESKFDDKPRFIWKELAKQVFVLPYVGGLAGAARQADYLAFIGMPRKKIHLGYDTLSVQRVRRLAEKAPAPEGVPYRERHFTVVARFVPKKDIPTAIRAYARYLELCRSVRKPSRKLVLCGDGPERKHIATLVEDLSLQGVEFRGFVQEKGVADALSSTLALILPSKQEQWGLVINEAIAMSVPILCSINCGAADDLVRVGVNGYVFAAGESEGLAHLMCHLAEDEAAWSRLCRGSLMLADMADVRRFGDAVQAIIARG